MDNGIKIISGRGELNTLRESKATRLREKREANLPGRTKEVANLLMGWAERDYSAKAKLMEAVSTADFVGIMNQINDQAMLAQYARLPSVWQTFSSRVTVPDFRPQRMRSWFEDLTQLPEQNGGFPRAAMALPRVPELTEYPTFSLQEEREQFGVGKYGKRFPFSWEAFVNDEYQVIQSLPAIMAQTANDTEDILTTMVLAGPDGPQAPFFNTTEDFGPLVPAGNYLEGNPALSIPALEQALENVSMRRVNGRPVTVNSWVLVVPPSLEFTARRIASVAEYTYVEGDPSLPSGQTRMVLPNLVSGRFQVVVNPWLATIDESETAATTWYLVPAGGSDGTRQAIVTAFLAGEEVPDLRISGLQGQAIGGGSIDPYRGSFSHDDVQYRVRHILGAMGLNNAPVVVSLGTGNGES
jgi:hypothetical protein